MSDLLTLAREGARRASKRQILDDLHEGQRRFIYARDETTDSLAMLVNLRSPRRFGKTEGFCRLGGYKCETIPGFRVLLCYQQAVDAREIAWPIIEDLREKYGWQCRLNSVEMALHEGDVSAPPRALRQLDFDQVMMNPPYHAETAMASPVAGRDRAHREDEGGGDLSDWIAAGLARLKPKGWLTVIHRAERAPELLRLLDGPAGSIALLPLVPRAGRDAGRVIIRARKGAKGPFRLLSPLVIHTGSAHVRDEDDFSPEAAAILRDAAALDFQETTR